MNEFQINRNHVEPEFSTLSRTIPEFISDGVLVQDHDHQDLADTWTVFRILEKEDAVQPAIEQGMRVKTLLDELAGWTDEDDQANDQLAEVDRLQEALQAHHDEPEDEDDDGQN